MQPGETGIMRVTGTAAGGTMYAAPKRGTAGALRAAAVDLQNLPQMYLSPAPAPWRPCIQDHAVLSLL